MMVFFRTRLGKTLIWQKFVTRESPTLSAVVQALKLNKPRGRLRK